MNRTRVVEVVNLDTGETRTYMGMSPKRAVILAYEQSRNNWSWWITPMSDHPKLVETPGYFQCGNWCVKKEKKWPTRFFKR